MGKRRKKTREQDVTERYLAGDFDDDAVETARARGIDLPMLP